MALLYDPDTGLLIYTAKTAKKIRVGDIVESFDKYGYRRVCIEGKSYKAHRLIWFLVTGEDPQMLIDHIDGNPGNNAWSNLRLCTSAENMMNRRPWEGRQFKGVYPQKNGRFFARIVVKKNPVYLGTFDTAEEAAREYDRVALEEFGDFAKLNFPEEIAA